MLFQHDRIHAFVPGNVIDKHENGLNEGNIYAIANFSVKEYRFDEKFRCINSEKQIIFTAYTEVYKVDADESLIPNNMFDFYDLSDLSDIANQNKYLTGKTLSVVKCMHTNDIFASDVDKFTSFEYCVFLQSDVIGIVEKDMPLSNLINKLGNAQTLIKFTIVDGR